MLRKMIPLATMDCDGGNFESCVKFFPNLNNALGDGIFDPCVTVLDDKGCNWLTLQSVYGEGFISRVVSCEWSPGTTKRPVLVNKEGNFRTCNGCLQKSLDIDIIGRIELDFSIKPIDDGFKQWKLSNRPRYYHPSIECLRKRRPLVVITKENIRVDSASRLTADIVSALGR